MLVKYRNEYAKIAMGFLSFEPDLKDMGHLQTELKLYTEDAAHQLYLYRETADGDFEGVVGVESGNDFVVVRHLSLSPNVRTQETQFSVLANLREFYPEKRLMGSLETTPLIAKFNNSETGETNGTHTSAE